MTIRNSTSGRRSTGTRTGTGCRRCGRNCLAPFGRDTRLTIGLILHLAYSLTTFRGRGSQRCDWRDTIHHTLLTASRPPANDAANEHQYAAIPDKRGQRIDKDAYSCLRTAIPVGQKDIDIGQAKGRDGDQAAWLIPKVLVEGAPGIDIALYLTILKDLHHRLTRFVTHLSSYAIAKLSNPIATTLHSL